MLPTHRLLSIIGTFLFVIGIGFFLLTTIMYDDVPKKKCLVFVPIYCVSAQVATAVLAGSEPTGIMPKWMHIAEVSVQIVLFLILSTAVWGNLPLARHENPMRGGMALSTFFAVCSSFWMCLNTAKFSQTLVNRTATYSTFCPKQLLIMSLNCSFCMDLASCKGPTMTMNC